MRVIDLSHSINKDMTTYTQETKPCINKIATINNQGYNETKINIFSHNGTHIDAPYHMIKEGKSLDKFDIDSFLGNAIIIDVSHITKHIEVQDLKSYEKQIAVSDFVILNTSWWKKWRRDEFFRNFPVLSEEAAKYLISFNLKGVGVDTISVDSFNSKNYEIHNILLDNEKLIIENLNNLDKLPEKFLFIATPLKYEEADGCPVRAIAVF